MYIKLYKYKSIFLHTLFLYVCSMRWSLNSFGVLGFPLNQVWAWNRHQLPLDLSHKWNPVWRLPELCQEPRFCNFLGDNLRNHDRILIKDQHPIFFCSFHTWDIMRSCEIANPMAVAEWPSNPFEPAFCVFEPSLVRLRRQDLPQLI